MTFSKYAQVVIFRNFKNYIPLLQVERHSKYRISKLSLQHVILCFNKVQENLFFSKKKKHYSQSSWILLIGNIAFLSMLELTHPNQSIRMI